MNRAEYLALCDRQYELRGTDTDLFMEIMQAIYELHLHEKAGCFPCHCEPEA